MKPQLDRLNARQWIFPLNRQKRSYQFSIVEAALLENTLVALPTGLGKTFIASVIMLNYWRWFPTGKIIFMCPTKPLVAQQITACHEVCGIPGTDAAELHGEISKDKRARLWEQKRVFYMTPQTLDNDLQSENLDVRDIVLLVVDEAHRATGEYAYATAIRRITARNPHFRILALTATPSSDKEKMQPIIDALHISHIEIRSEASPDILPYIKKKERKEYIIQMPPHLAKLRDGMAKIMLPILKQFKNGEIRGTLDPLYIRPFTLKSALDALRSSKQSPPPWVYSNLANLHALSGAMGYFLEYSPKLALEHLEARLAEVDSNGQAKKAPNYTQTREYKQLIKDFKAEEEHGRLIHPKLEKLRALLIDYFVQAMEGDDPERKNSKAIVFVSFRACVEEIVEYLKADAPLINAAKFIGQGEDKKGGKGMAQSEQLELIERFRGGEFNVLISTSIGEEGLDIGEVDLIVCYETPSSPIRGLQRAGRTGRKRDGQFILLMTENREEQNWKKAQEKYEQVQYSIRMAKYELFSDVPRLLPDDITPTCVERAVECEPYVREVKKKRKSKAAADEGEEGGDPPSTQTQKKKRNSDPARNIPEGAATGFVTASSLRKKRKKGDEDGDDDADERPRKRASKKSKANEVLTFDQVMAEIDGEKPPKKASRKRATSKKKKDDPQEELTYSQVRAEIESGSDADAPAPPSKTKSKAKSSGTTSKSKAASSSSTKSRSASIPADRSIIDLCDSSAILPPPAPNPADKYKWILSSDDDSEIEVVSTTKSTSVQPSVAFQSARSLSRAPEPTFDSDVEMVESTPAKTTRPLSSSTIANSRPASPPPTSSFAFVKPALPTVIPESSPEVLTQVIRAPGQARRRVLSVPDLSFDSPEAGPISRLKRVPDLPSSSPIQPPPPKRRARTRVRADPARRAERNELLDTVAVHSGDENDPDAGDTSDSEAEESESDRRFVTEVPATQADSSYDQDAAYRTSLFTQALPGARGPCFASGPARKNSHLNAREHENRMRRRAAGVSSSPVQDHTMSDYEMDSFVVGDDDPIIPDSSEP
ncbi:P-loop containing nucleoside triphosphate hydrolase protein [Auricularia subglabra TFB-10046 SS5]|nr:P-loop containing nucleoside triphosphate hydrolase protein [Auricularia subglabra TFB-10046 SS5]